MGIRIQFYHKNNVTPFLPYQPIYLYRLQHKRFVRGRPSGVAVIIATSQFILELGLLFVWSFDPGFIPSPKNMHVGGLAMLNHECVCSWCPVMNWHHIQGFFLLSCVPGIGSGSTMTLRRIKQFPWELWRWVNEWTESFGDEWVNILRWLLKALNALLPYCCCSC